jgi:hypothetical protein
MATTHTFGADPRTTFIQSGTALHLGSLFGFSCGFFGEDSGLDRVRGISVLDTDRGRFETHAMNGAVMSATPTAAAFAWEANGMRLESAWDFSFPGIATRRDRLSLASGAKRLRVRRAMARFVLAPGAYEAFVQESRWCHESQGAWRDTHGGIDIASEGARTCLGATPYLALREKGSGRGLAFNLVPRGNWKIRAQHVSTGFTTRPMALVVEMGMSDETLDWALEPGESIELPEIIVQHLPTGAPEAVSADLHRFLLSRVNGAASAAAAAAAASAGRHAEPPVLYNTWYDVFDRLDPERLRGQLAAARRVGCDVFTIDAGWYGRGTGPWDMQVGDFREKLDGAFRGHMAEFAKEVRAAGLGFGLWVEPERLGPDVPVAKEHPDWFAPAPSGFLYPRFIVAGAREYTYRMVADLVERYELAWIKIDFNHELGYDPDGAEFARHLDSWYGIVDRLVAAYPGTFFEGCQSGALRKDLAALSHWDGNFLSDNMNPFMSARIYEQEMLRYLPGRITRWLCIRPAGAGIIEYGKSLADSKRRVVAAGSSGWDQAELMDLDQAFKLVFPGILGISGDIAGFDEGTLQQLARYVGIYKQWRGMIKGSVAWPLTQVGRIDDRTGYAGLQLMDPDAKRSLLFCSWFDLVAGKATLHPRGLAPDRSYKVRTLEGAPRAAGAASAAGAAEITGRRLMAEGLEFSFENGQCAEVVTLES